MTNTKVHRPYQMRRFRAWEDGPMVTIKKYWVDPKGTEPKARLTINIQASVISADIVDDKTDSEIFDSIVDLNKDSLKGMEQLVNQLIAQFN